MKIRLLKIAQQELDEAVEWYNLQALGLGLVRFMAHSSGIILIIKSKIL